MSERIAFPADWTSASIKDIVDPSRTITYGIVQPGPRFDPDCGIPMIRGQDYSSGTVRTDNLYYVDPRLAASFSRASVQGGDLLVSIVGYVGTVAEVPDELAGANLTQTTARISVREQLKGRYFLHFLRSRCFRDEVGRFTKGSAQPGLNLADVEVMRVAYPQDASERAAIAEVLDTLDTTIRQTEVIIEKLKQVKQGLLHDLLTRGIAVNGELRPPQSQTPYLYKDSPLGWIPVAWQVKRLEELLSSDDPAMRSGPFGSALLKHELVESGFPLLGIDNVHVERFDAGFTRFVTEEKFNDLARYAVRPHDLMITIMGTVGRCCVVPDGIGSALSSKHTWTITLDRAKYSPLLAMLQINYCAWILRQFAKDEQGGIMSAIRSETLRNLLFPAPHIEEQREIESRMRAISTRIDAESAALGKLRLEKSGLMDDLLTGRVRVTPLLA